MKRFSTICILTLLLFLLATASLSGRNARPASAAPEEPAALSALKLCGSEVYLPITLSAGAGGMRLPAGTTGVVAGFVDRADVNGDGCDDLIVGVPNEDLVGFTDNGSAQILYGSLEGITETANWSFYLDTPGIPGVAANGDQFGTSLALGDFDNDGYSDVAIGVPMKTVDGEAMAGAVIVLYGSPDGLTADGSQYWSQASAGVTLANEAGDQFGWALATGDFNGDGYDELAVGIPGEDVGNQANAGTVYVLQGSENRLTATGATTWNQANGDLIDNAEAGDLYGWALTAGNFNKDFRDDLAIGIPGEEGNSGSNYGYVSVIYGGESGLDPATDQLWGQDGLGLAVSGEDGDQFGAILASGDIDQDRADDLVIGVPWEDAGGQTDSGVAHILYGGNSGLTTDGAQTWSVSDGGAGAPQTEDYFALALATGDFDGDGFDDVAFGVPGRDLPSGNLWVINAGLVVVARGSEAGLDGGAQLLQQPGSLGSDSFGSAFQAADFNGDHRIDLAVGAPRRAVDGNGQAGVVNVFYGAGAGLDVANAETWDQDSAGVAGEAEPDDLFGWALP